MILPLTISALILGIAIAELWAYSIRRAIREALRRERNESTQAH